jgi:hypothetical protein
MNCSAIGDGSGRKVGFVRKDFEGKNFTKSNFMKGFRGKNVLQKFDKIHQ